MYRDKNIHCKDEILLSIVCRLLIDHFFFQHVYFKRYKIFSASLVFYCEKICDILIGFWLWYKGGEDDINLTCSHYRMGESNHTYCIHGYFLPRMIKIKKIDLVFTRWWLGWVGGIKGGKNKTGANISCIQ